MIVSTFLMTMLVVYLASNSKQGRKERASAGTGMKVLLGVLLAITLVMGVVTTHTLTQRWRRASVDVFASEV